MTTTIETDLKEILSEFKQEFVKINQRLEKIDENVTDLKVNQIRMEERLSGQINLLDERLSGQINLLDERLSAQINLLDEKVSGLGKRIENQEFTNRGILIGLIVVVLGGAAKVFGFLPNS
jgi:primosomal protein N''